MDLNQDESMNERNELIYTVREWNKFKKMTIDFKKDNQINVTP